MKVSCQNFSSFLCLSPFGCDRKSIFSFTHLCHINIFPTCSTMRVIFTICFCNQWILIRSFSAVDTLVIRAGTGRNFVPGYLWLYYRYPMLLCPIKLKINNCPSLCILALAHVHVRPNMASNSLTLSKSQVWQYFSLLPGKQKTKCKLFYFVFKDL